MPTVIRWWEALRAPEVTKLQQKCRVDWDATDGRNGGAQRTVWELLMEMKRINGKVKENCTEKHRNVARKIFLEGGWTEKSLSDVGWSDISQCQASQIQEGTEKHRLHSLSGMARSEARCSGRVQEMGEKGENIEERMEMAQRVNRAPTKWKRLEQRKFQDEDVGV